MEKLYRHTFMSWDEESNVLDMSRDERRLVLKDKTRAIALCDGTWFFAAINTLRDGDMGEKDENGVYSRIWYGDDIFNTDVQNVQPASLSEVALYMKYNNLEKQAEEEGREIVAIIYGAFQTDVLFRDKLRP